MIFAINVVKIFLLEETLNDKSVEIKHNTYSKSQVNRFYTQQISCVDNLKNITYCIAPVCNEIKN